MIKILLSKSSWISFLIAFILSFWMAAKLYAQTPGETAKKHNVTFPIVELGNCANISECRQYCEDPLHQTQCIDFAKKKGFYKEQGTAVKNAILNYAKQELGCDSEDSCKTFCGEQTNWQKCGDFAKKHNLSGGQVEDPAKKEILSQAKQVLGCGSYDECKGFCTKEENRQKCDEFAKLVGLRGGVEHRGPGGCTSEETCKAFCADPQNFQICQGYTSSYGEKFKGPGGCDSEALCQAYCREHQDECRFFKGGGGPAATFNPQELCYKTPNCTWKDNSCFCASASFSPYPSSSYDPAKKCVEYGCSWTGTTCNCANKTPYPSYTPHPSYTPYPYYTSYPTSTPQGGTTACQPPSSGCGSNYYWDTSRCACRSYEDACRSNGCTWTNNTCQCSTTPSSSSTPVPSTTSTSNSTPQPTSNSYQDPATVCAQTSGCSWTGTTCQCSSVHGVSTVRGLLQDILNWLRQ